MGFININFKFKKFIIVLSMKLQELNIHERDKRLFFDEEPHIYYLDNKKIDISCTTFVHSHFPHFNQNSISKNLVKKNFNNPDSKYYQKTQDDILNEWEANRVDASNKGTHLHKSIELFYNDEVYQNENIEFQYFLKFHEDYSHLVPYRTEWEVFHEELDLAGSIDMVFYNTKTDKLEIFDWKRSKEIKKGSYDNGFSPLDHLPNSNFWHYSLQLNLYKYILEKKYDKTIGDLNLVILHPNHYTYRVINVPLLTNEIDSIVCQRQQKRLKEQKSIL